MLPCFIDTPKNARIIQWVTADNEQDMLNEVSPLANTWLTNHNFQLHSDQAYLLPNSEGQIERVLYAPKDATDYWQFASVIKKLPAGYYQLSPEFTKDAVAEIILAWGLESYSYDVYKSAEQVTQAQLYVDVKQYQVQLHIIDSLYWVRDLINMPANDMNTTRLAQAAADLAATFNAELDIISGEDLLKQNYPAIYTVGKAGESPPRLIDLRWGEAKHPLIGLVGKGVCFDTGGLDIKPASGMLLMKKDMGGAAHVLGLAQMIMQLQLPIRLRVLIPTVENNIAANAYRPSDVIHMRNGKTVEVQNTDAEGRLILADALTALSADRPELLIDFATLTGSARSAVGPDIAAMFCNQQLLANQLVELGEQVQDNIWQLPLHQAYERYLKSDIADWQNCTASPYAGAIVAALFLQFFVAKNIPWVHFDLMGANVDYRPGHPKGGEGLGLRALLRYLQHTYQTS